jgi:hypothetical protein
MPAIELTLLDSISILCRYAQDGDKINETELVIALAKETVRNADPSDMLTAMGNVILCSAE